MEKGAQKVIEYQPFELHTHTCHSDGSFHVEELCQTASEYGYAGIALTDHNTSSGLQEVTKTLEERTVMVIPGIEWTTYYGHMLVLGAKEYVDWRYALPETIDEYLEKIKTVDGVTGIAHPFRVGAPICTGCYWEFKVTKWELIDYIEIWSLPAPQERPENKRAIKMWEDLLDQGYHLAATSGRDWHGFDEKPVLLASTYLGLNEGELTAENALAAIRAGRTYITIGPELIIKIEDGMGNKAELGDTLKCTAKKKWKIHIVWEETDDMEEWKILPREIVLVGDHGEKIEAQDIQEQEVVFELNSRSRWYRLELTGDIGNEKKRTLAITSPIYMEQ
ncbi:MAG: PHP domain-containing protein [Clostridia bacterium]|nr:PHP domain-containing protein [Clostridia bacterium]